MPVPAPVLVATTATVVAEPTGVVQQTGRLTVSFFYQEIDDVSAGTGSATTARTAGAAAGGPGTVAAAVRVERDVRAAFVEMTGDVGQTQLAFGWRTLEGGRQQSVLRFRGFLQADGYSGFGPLYKAADGRDAVVLETEPAPVGPRNARATGHGRRRLRGRRGPCPAAVTPGRTA